ncbi:LANO_0G01816g1_1 [Lachancea nothofagi CBS 11611]|uniref:Plasma membrane fusion protein PRM1 n=1 Tax=Lachancea nothofagi CBS 11611 TaxID=1266666 RepID=A0A1G4KEY3_9SACH|nr:LANO_0G01816g1_1 [Lachancea nothofagi CBS 11611]
MSLKPYLQLRDRISQVWLNQYTILLILTMVKIVLFSLSLKNAIATSRDYALSSCDSIDYFYSEFMNSAPAYMCQFGNYLIEKSIQESVKASLKTVSLLIGAGEQIALFLFDFYFGTYICLATSAVDGAVDVATNTTKKLLGAVNETVTAVGNDVDSGLDDLSQVIDKMLKAASSVENFFKGGSADDVDSSVKSVNLSIAKLRDLHIPSSIDAKLSELADKTPNFDTVMNKTHSEISKPFELVRSKVTAVNVSRLMTSNQTMYMPAANSSNVTSGICASSKPDLLKYYAGVSKTINVLVIVLVTLLAIGAIIAMSPSVWSEYKQWTRLRNLQVMVGEKLPSHGPDYGSDVIENYQRVFAKWPTAFGEWLAQRLSTSMRTRRKIRWCVAYALSPRALTVLGIALAGIVMCICQFILLAAAARAMTGKDAQNFSNAALSSASSSLNGDMVRWTASTNSYINSTKNQLNSEVFGWTQDTTVSLNNTLNTAIHDIDTVLADFFNGTLLYKPMTSVVRCTIENKLYKIQKALTWIHENLQFPIPLIDANALQDWALNQSDPSSQRQSNTTSSTALEISNLTHKIALDTQEMLKGVLNQFRSATMLELTISLVLFGLWLIQWLIAILKVYLTA